MPSAATTNAAAAAIASKVRMLQVPPAVDTQVLQTLRNASITLAIGLYIALAFSIILAGCVVAPLVPCAKYLFSAALYCLAPPKALAPAAYEWSQEEFPKEKEMHHERKRATAAAADDEDGSDIAEGYAAAATAAVAGLSQSLAALATEVADALAITSASSSSSSALSAKRLIQDEALLLNPPTMRAIASSYVRAFAFGSKF